MMQAAQSRHSNNLARCARVRPSRASGRWPRPLAFGDRGWKPLYNWSISSYAPDGNVLAMTDLVMGGWTYTYDDMNRLTSGTAASGVDEGLTLGWNYDRYGNRGPRRQVFVAGVINRWDQSVTGTGNATAVSPQLSFTGNNNRIDGWSYDAAGNLLYDQIHHYTYDAENRVATVDGQQAYIYDAEGRRIAKLGSGGAVTASYVLGLGGEQVSEVNGSGVWVHSNVFVGGRLMATYAGSGDTAKQGYHYHLTDWLGTQRMQTSASGNEEERCYSYPFGDGLNCTGADATEHHFTSKERDTESGLDYFGARYLSSNLGRFMTPDWAASPTTVPYASFGDPQSLNLYAYVGNNPNTGIDLDGHDEDTWDDGQEEQAEAEEAAGEAEQTAEGAGEAEAAASPEAASSGSSSGGSSSGAPATPAPKNPDPPPADPAQKTTTTTTTSGTTTKKSDGSTASGTTTKKSDGSTASGTTATTTTTAPAPQSPAPNKDVPLNDNAKAIFTTVGKSFPSWLSDKYFSPSTCNNLKWVAAASLVVGVSAPVTAPVTAPAGTGAGLLLLAGCPW